MSDPDATAVLIKEEPVDPLQMDMDEDDIEYEPDRLNDQLIVSLFQNLAILRALQCSLAG